MTAVLHCQVSFFSTYFGLFDVEHHPIVEIMLPSRVEKAQKFEWIRFHVVEAKIRKQISGTERFSSNISGGRAFAQISRTF